MKQLLFTLCVATVSTYASAQVADTLNDKAVKDKVLNEIQSTLDRRTRAIDSTVSKLDEKVGDLDKSIKETKDAKEKADKLFLRVQALEDKQKATEQNDLYIYQANYQSAIVNLVSMEREIKPLLLFNSTKSFFSQLSEASNPMNYPGYKEWYNGFNQYLNTNKDKETTLSIVSNVLSFAGNATQGVPLTGPITYSLFSGMSSYISSLGKKQKDLKEQSEKMLTLTMKISQFDHDKDQIEHEWESITTELLDLQTLYDKSIKQNLSLLKVNTPDFTTGFSKETDAEKRYQYLTGLRKQAAEYVTGERNNNTKDWKQSIYYQMMDVQSLKTRFGQITFRISENIKRYAELFAKYKSDPQIGSQISGLEIKLSDLRDTFDKAFDPLEYINSASRMYKVG